MNGFLFGKEGFVDVVWNWNLNIMIGVLRSEGRGSFNIQKEDHVKMKVEIGVMRSWGCYQKLEKSRRETLLGTVEGVWLCQNLDSGLPASRIVRQQISVV